MDETIVDPVEIDPRKPPRRPYRRQGDPRKKMMVYVSPELHEAIKARAAEMRLSPSATTAILVGKILGCES